MMRRCGGYRLVRVLGVGSRVYYVSTSIPLVQRLPTVYDAVGNEKEFDLHDRCKIMALHKLLDQMINGRVEIPRTNSLPDSPFLEILH